MKEGGRGECRGTRCLSPPSLPSLSLSTHPHATERTSHPFRMATRAGASRRSPGGVPSWPWSPRPQQWTPPSPSMPAAWVGPRARVAHRRTPAGLTGRRDASRPAPRGPVPDDGVGVRWCVSVNRGGWRAFHRSLCRIWRAHTSSIFCGRRNGSVGGGRGGRGWAGGGSGIAPALAPPSPSNKPRTTRPPVFVVAGGQQRGARRHCQVGPVLCGGRKGGRRVSESPWACVVRVGVSATPRPGLAGANAHHSCVGWVQHHCWRARSTLGGWCQLRMEWGTGGASGGGGQGDDAPRSTQNKNIPSPRPWAA